MISKLVVVKSYIPPARHRVPEFWDEEKINYVRASSQSGLPPYALSEPRRVGRLLDRISFKDLRPREVNELLEKADKLDVDVGMDFFGTRLSVPIYVGDMSFGALSGNPNIAIAKAVTEFGAVAGIGEGGLHPEVAKYRNIVVQWASARFGMGLDLLRAGLAVNIKIGQGAKPGIGGHLPGRKVVDIIAQLRKIPKGSDALSPAPHHDIYSIEDLAQRVKALRDISKKPVLVKVAAVNKIMYVAVGVARSTAEGIIIDGAGAGTGATPLAIRNHLGIPIDYAIPVVHEWLRKNGVRDNFLVIGGGMLFSAEDVAKLIALGADMANIGTAALLSFGCIMCHACHTGGCPTALTNLIGYGKELDIEWAAGNLKNYLKALEAGLKAIVYALGFSSVRELVGRKDLLKIDYVDEEVASTIGVELGTPGGVAFYGKYEPVVSQEVYERGEPPIIGMGGVVPGYTYPARRPLDLLRIEAVQVTRPSVDPYREPVSIEVNIGRFRADTPVGVAAEVDEALVEVGKGLGAFIYGNCEDELCVNNYDWVAVPPSGATRANGVAELGREIIVVDERLGGDMWLEEYIPRLDVELKKRRVRDRVVVVAVGEFYDGADVYKLAALGADVIVPLGIFTYIHRRFKDLPMWKRAEKYENAILSIEKELKLAMGAGGVTNYQHMVGNRDLVRSLDGAVAKRLGVEVAGR